MNRLVLSGLLALAAWSLAGCEETLPTVAMENLIPTDAVTVEVRLPFDDFAEDLRVFGGYGSPSQLPYGTIAHQYEGELEARTLIGFWDYPVLATVRDTTGTSRPDSSLAFVGGRLVAVMDTIASVHGGTVELAAGVLPKAWHYRSVDWQAAVDTVGGYDPWEEEGAGPVIPVATAIWDPSEADSVIFELDSAAVAHWADTTSSVRGVRLDALTPGVRLQTRGVRLHLDTRPSSNPDTLINLVVQSRYRSFVYEPVLEAPEADFRVGGVPAWRTILYMKFPKILNGPPELCQKLGCPLELEPEMVNAASLYLTTKAPPPGFVPSDTLRIDVRAVLEPQRLPKSPLGNSLAGYLGVSVPPEYFGENAGTQVEVPIGGYVGELIRGETSTGGEVSETMALLSSLEPLSLPFGVFYGPGSEFEPEIRLILTLGGGVEIR